MIEHSTNPLAYPLFLALGTLIHLLGIGLMLLYVVTRTRGYRTTGTILGAIKRIRTKHKKGREPELKTNHYLVIEYPSPAGDLKKGTVSEWNNTYKSFVEGQVVDLIVVTSAVFDDLYLKDDHSSLKIGSVLSLIGLFMLFMVSRSAVFWSIVGVVTVILAVGLYIFLSRIDPSKAPLPASKAFTDDEVFPIGKIGQ